MLRAMQINSLILVSLVWCFSGSGLAMAAGCAIDGPTQLMPSQLERIFLGMSKADLEAVLGPADYAPAEGLYYFSTGGDCRLDDEQRTASCGVIADFRRPDRTEQELTDVLQSCRWGAIGE